MKDHERKAWIKRARQRISILEQENAILQKKLDEYRAKRIDSNQMVQLNTENK